MPRHIFSLLAVVAALLPLGVRAQSSAAAPAAVLGPADAVRVTVYRKPELTGEFDLAPDGSIVHPLYRQVRVTGIPMSEAEERLRVFLARYEQNPQFVVEALYRIPVEGEVRQPRVYSLKPGVTVSDAVAIAGGPTERGRVDRIRLVRTTGTVMVDLNDPGTNGGRLPLASGDQVFVERRVNALRDYVAPAASVVAALTTLLSLIIK
ncbi:MAG TPA: polysaccharide biosynthesis/export family protein [Longimicrobium sp.]|nr:polysaccharide biosynthesis/export family protein [Longimicrobium sp.]